MWDTEHLIPGRDSRQGERSFLVWSDTWPPWAISLLDWTTGFLSSFPITPHFLNLWLAQLFAFAALQCSPLVSGIPPSLGIAPAKFSLVVVAHFFHYLFNVLFTYHGTASCNGGCFCFLENDDTADLCCARKPLHLLHQFLPHFGLFV